jgi:hypothetical protein
MAQGKPPVKHLECSAKAEKGEILTSSTWVGLYSHVTLKNHEELDVVNTGWHNGIANGSEEWQARRGCTPTGRSNNQQGELSCHRS